jgi:hypothetical protein
MQRYAGSVCVSYHSCITHRNSLDVVFLLSCSSQQQHTQPRECTLRGMSKSQSLNRLEVEQKVVYPRQNGLVFSLNKPPQHIPKPQAVASLGCGSTPLRIAVYVCAVQQVDDVPLFLYFIVRRGQLMVPIHW